MLPRTPDNVNLCDKFPFPSCNARVWLQIEWVQVERLKMCLFMHLFSTQGWISQFMALHVSLSCHSNLSVMYWISSLQHKASLIMVTTWDGMTMPWIWVWHWVLWACCTSYEEYCDSAVRWYCWEDTAMWSQSQSSFACHARLWLSLVSSQWPFTWSGTKGKLCFLITPSAKMMKITLWGRVPAAKPGSFTFECFWWVLSCCLGLPSPGLSRCFKISCGQNCIKCLPVTNASTNVSP